MFNDEFGFGTIIGVDDGSFGGKSDSYLLHFSRCCFALVQAFWIFDSQWTQ